MPIATTGDLTAAQAFGRARKVGTSGQKIADDLNYSLTLKRLLSSISQTAESGGTRMAFVAPWIVLDGTTTNPVMLARQLEIKLTDLGYNVNRIDKRLFIDWDMELQRKEEEIKEKNKNRLKAEKRKQEDRMRNLKRKAFMGPTNPKRSTNNRSSYSTEGTWEDMGISPPPASAGARYARRSQLTQAENKNNKRTGHSFKVVKKTKSKGGR